MNKQFIEQGLELIKTVDIVYLTTIDPYGFPSTRAMLNLRHEKKFPQLVDYLSQYDKNLTLFFTTSAASTKCKHISNNSNCSAYYCNIESMHSFLCQGKIEIVKDKFVKDAIWLDEWLTHFPNGRDSELYTVLKLNPIYV